MEEKTRGTKSHSETRRAIAYGALHWYVVKVHEGYDDSIACKCRKLIAPSVLADCFSPKVELLRKYGGTWRKVEQPLYPGYLLAVSRPSRLFGVYVSKRSRLRTNDRIKRLFTSVNRIIAPETGFST